MEYRGSVQEQEARWWRRIGQPLSEQKEKKEEDNNNNASDKKSSPKKANVPRYGAGGSSLPYNYEDPDKKPFKMTEQLRLLQDTRKSKVTQEVEDEFKAMHQ